MDERPILGKPNGDPEQAGMNEELLRRLIRLLVGMILVGQDALRNQLPKWETEAAVLLEERERGGSNQTESAELPPPTPPWFPKAWEHRLIGFAFESPNYLKGGAKRLMATQRTLWRFTAPLRLPLELLGVSDMTRSWLDGIIERFHDDMVYFEQVGQQEALPSRALGQAALVESLNGLLALLSDNEGIQDLVQTQTTGITEEVIGEVRERSVSADTLIDALVRKLLRQSHLPPEKRLNNLDPEDERRMNDW